MIHTIAHAITWQSETIFMDHRRMTTNCNLHNTCCNEISNWPDKIICVCVHVRVCAYEYEFDG